MNDIISGSTSNIDPIRPYDIESKVDTLDEALSYLEREQQPSTSKERKHHFYHEYIEKVRIRLTKLIKIYPNLLIMNADKWNVPVLIEKTAYEKKIQESLNAGILKGTFKKHTERFLGKRLKAIITNTRK